MISIANKEAAKSEHRYRLGAVITKGDRILSAGYNELRYTHVIKTYREYEHSLHAEQSAIMKLLKKNKLSDLIGFTMYVSRISDSGKPRLAKPCEECECLIRSVGIKKVVYTTDDNLVIMKM